MLDSRPLMSVTPFYVAFKRPISTESKVYVRVHHTDEECATHNASFLDQIHLSINHAQEPLE
jgi:hypothetical protein